jgi:hypothetical protein
MRVLNTFNLLLGASFQDCVRAMGINVFQTYKLGSSDVYI